MNHTFGIDSHEFGAYIAALNFISQQQRTVRYVLIPFMHNIIEGWKAFISMIILLQYSIVGAFLNKKCIFFSFDFLKKECFF